MALTDALIDDKKLTDDARQIVDRAQAAADIELKQVNLILGQQISAAVLQISNVIHGLLDGLQAIEDKSAADGHSLIDRLDGWTLTATATVTLNKPKSK